MTKTSILACLVCATALPAEWCWADGGFFFVELSPGDAAQSRQEVLMAFFEGADSAPRATYVLRSRYIGFPAEFAWVVPVPATPTDVVAHEDGRLLEWLNERTVPRVLCHNPASGLGGCGCGVFGDSGQGSSDAVTRVEASGTAGIFEWAALTSSGAHSLLTWLNDHSYAVPSAAAAILDGYIQQEMHFLAVRIAKPEQTPSNVDGEIELPPLQFTCQTARRFYPLAISRVSAAAQTELLIYVLAAHRAAAANVANAVIDPNAVTFTLAEGRSNYETLFAETLAAAGGVALITEAVVPMFGAPRYDGLWPDVPTELLDASLFLTRLRTEVTPDQMTTDLEFRDASTDDELYSDFWITPSGTANVTALAGPPAAAAVLLAGARALWRRRRHRYTRPHG